MSVRPVGSDAGMPSYRAEQGRGGGHLANDYREGDEVFLFVS